MDLTSRRTAQPYLSALATRATEHVVSPGSSSYFTAPTAGLDPTLFNGRSMRPAVRRWLQDTLHGYLTGAGFEDSHEWARIWLAGSGASYQWSAARDPGDLDILIGVNYEQFRQTNPRYAGLSDLEISDTLNVSMVDDLWKRTANQKLGASTYEVTWYVNPGSTDIRNIHPYAAYDVDRGEWTVDPIELPAAGPGEWFPKEYAAAAQRDQQRTLELVAAYNKAHAALQGATRTGDYVNAATQLAAVSRQAEDLFDEIHLGRHAAFDETGEGYRDYANYRWQRGKLLGTIPALRAIRGESKEAREAADTELYGQKLTSTEATRVAAALGRVT